MHGTDLEQVLPHRLGIPAGYGAVTAAGLARLASAANVCALPREPARRAVWAAGKCSQYEIASLCRHVAAAAGVQ